MDKFGRPTSGRLSPSLDKQQISSPSRPQRPASAAPSGDVKNAGAACRTKGGKHVSLPPSGARTGRSAHITASRAPAKIEATPIPPLCKKPRLQDSVLGIVPPSKPPSTQRPVPTPNSSDNDDDDDAEYSYLSKLPNPDP